MKLKLRHIYFIIAILGTIIPYFHFVKFLRSNGPNFKLFMEQMVGTDISAFFTWDVVISTLAVVTLVMTEGKRIKMKNLWIYVAFNLTVGVSLALPAFLYSRQKEIDKQKKLNTMPNMR